LNGGSAAIANEPASVAAPVAGNARARPPRRSMFSVCRPLDRPADKNSSV
jgi:hypothetical protein